MATEQIDEQDPMATVDNYSAYEEEEENDPSAMSLVEHLEELLGTVQVPEAVRAEVTQAHPLGGIVLHQVMRGLREENLSAVRGRADPGCTVDVDPDIPPGRVHRLSGVEPHAHAHRNTARPSLDDDRPLRVNRSSHRIARASERDEERISLGVDLVAGPRLDSRADQSLVFCEEVCVPVAEGLQEARGALDVGQQERHRPHGQLEPASAARAT